MHALQFTTHKYITIVGMDLCIDRNKWSEMYYCVCMRKEKEEEKRLNGLLDLKGKCESVKYNGGEQQNKRENVLYFL